MASYWVKSPAWMKCFFPSDMKWDVPVDKNDAAVYITFDDGPHPVITPFVLQQLSMHNAKATFFCVGNNVARFPDTYQQMIAEGHKPANHTYNHLNGWKTTNDHYLKNIQQAARHIDSLMFRPPYGRIKLSQYRKLKKLHAQWKVYMWDILSGDFDNTISPQQCADNVLAHIQPGSIVLFHDSEKAKERMQYALPQVLQHCTDNGWAMKVLPD
jgi:peptidoglycan-N-acetylglucosamine deacetylase